MFNRLSKHEKAFQLYKLKKAAFIAIEQAILTLNADDKSWPAENIRKKREVMNNGEVGTDWLITFNELQQSVDS